MAVMKDSLDAEIGKLFFFKMQSMNLCFLVIY